MNKNKIESSFNDPSQTLNFLITKLSFCVILLGTAIIFFQAKFNQNVIPLQLKKGLSVIIVLITCFYSILSLYEFVILMNKFENVYCLNNNCLYDNKFLNTIKNAYSISTGIFIIICFFIAFLMIKY